MEHDEQVWDVIVIGAGPAGSTAARIAASRGARVLILEKAGLPRYKTCGGGLIGTSMSALPADFQAPVVADVRSITFSLNGRFERTRHVGPSAPPLFSLVKRADLDHGLALAASGAGATIRDGCAVVALASDECRSGSSSADLVRVTTRDGLSFGARCVVGADGSASRVGRHIGVHCDEVDLGLEAEIPVPPQLSRHWSNRVALDWGTIPGSYGWVFPKGDTLSVGVIAARDNQNLTRSYFERFIERLGLSHFPPEVSSGHLVRCRTANSPLYRSRVLVAGDAAGLIEPFTREGISFALRSGGMAGEHAALMARATSPPAVADVGRRYSDAVTSTLGGEMSTGRLLLGLFEKYPLLFHTAVSTARPAWADFVDFMRGDSSFTDIMDQHKVLRSAIVTLARFDHARSRSPRYRSGLSS